MTSVEVAVNGTRHGESQGGLKPKSKKEYTLQELSDHHEVTSCWIAIRDKVYDVTNFIMHSHPGGFEILLEHVGTDATVAFQDKGHSQDAEEILNQYYIGELVERDRRVKVGE